MLDTFRDSTVGLFINATSGGHFLPFPDQRPGWQLPANLQLSKAISSSSDTIVMEKRESAVAESQSEDILKEAPDSMRTSTDGLQFSESDRKSLSFVEKGGASVRVDMLREDTIQESVSGTIVDWYDETDQDNPQNWSLNKRIFVLGLVSLLTFSVYIGSAIYTPSIPGIIEHFNVSKTTATLGLSLYVIGYGVGPLIFSPLSEVPSIGRTPVYMATLLIFVLLQLPTIYAPNIQTLLAMRFFAGFFGSPALATGGASIQDMFPIVKLPYALIAWSVAALCGPVLGPTIGGFAAQNKNWKWPIYELSWIGAAAFIILMFWLPETNAETILLKRARRLRALTGNPNLYSESEVKQSQMKSSDVLFEALLRPFQLMIEPAVLYANIYLGLAYAIFYLWFEAFPLVYNDIYHFNLGFILVYLPSSYPRYAASILAGNDLFRSTVAGCFPLFGTPLYKRLTIGGGCTFLAGLSIALIPGLFILYNTFRNSEVQLPQVQEQPLWTRGGPVPERVFGFTFDYETKLAWAKKHNLGPEEPNYIQVQMAWNEIMRQLPAGCRCAGLVHDDISPVICIVIANNKTETEIAKSKDEERIKAYQAVVGEERQPQWYLQTS
ncbi:hypothetical protein CVT25_007181 [Psilocybe cyanescens]|uniref:Major facilitator superfamily (MFS) profile domain-containing protein n=1 Tax=Psilocybe cyanescens TaxID=93625 RepID=A0A409X716_PSICY|nr:hypothetical protein CVT25_007181 [Psilocybe cyanescens]